MIKRCVAVVSVGAPVYRTSKKELVAMAPLLMEKTQALAKIWPIRGVE
jgi:DNA-binding IclR family transcriptional regulator